MNILHLAAHLGGGAGKAISGLAIQGQQDYSDTHRILLLQKPEKDDFIRECGENHVEVGVWDGTYAALLWADVVVVSWWNHPATARFLRELPPQETRMLMWCHVNGCHFPMLPYALAAAFDNVLFTSPYSLENPVWTEAERLEIEKRSALVWGMGRWDPALCPPKEEYQNGDDFTVGYVGTLNYGKIHPEFVSYCNAVCGKVPNAKFVMAGDRDAALERDVRAAGLAERCTFTGFIADVPALLRSFDVFGYLLNAEHYGTTENALVEAMSCGLPTVAMRQNVEKHIVLPDTGFLVDSPRQYGERMEFLRQNPAERERMGRSARACVLERYDAGENTARFQRMCRRAMENAKRIHSFSCLGDSPWEWFLFCLDAKNRKLFEAARDALETGGSGRARALLKDCSPILREKRKSSLRHFAAVHPEDRVLQTLGGLMEV